MAENKWIIDGHHYTCPDCKKTIAIVVNESDEGFDFCPFCGKRLSGQIAENKCEGCICIACRFKDTDDCFYTDLCIDCNKEYTTMLCPYWKKKEQKEDGRE